MKKNQKKNLFKIILSSMVCSVLMFTLALTGIKANATTASIEKYDYNTVVSSFENKGAQGLVKQYIKFLQDPTYTPGIANKKVYMPNFTNAKTFVNAQFNVKPSIFASLRSVNTSVLSKTRNFLWIGTDQGVTMIHLKSKETKSYTKDNGSLLDDKVLLLVDDGKQGVYAITETGVSHIIQE